MSIDAINWALEQPGTPTQKHVLLVLANYANESGIAFPSVATLAMDTGLSERAIKKARNDLLQAGLVVKSPKYGRSGFKLALDNKNFESARGAPKRAADAPKGERDAPLSESARGAPESAYGAHESARGAPPYNHQLTTNNHHTPHKPPKASKPAPKPKQDFELPDWIPADAWNGWIEMRRSIKKNPTPRAMALAVKTLGTLRQQGHAPGDVLDQSTLHGWQGLFPIKSQRVTGGNGGGPSRLSEAERNRQAIFDEMNAHYGTRANEHQGEVIFQ